MRTEFEDRRETGDREGVRLRTDGNLQRPRHKNKGSCQNKKQKKTNCQQTHFFPPPRIYIFRGSRQRFAALSGIWMGSSWRYQHLFVLHACHMNFHQVSGYFIMQQAGPDPGGVTGLDPGGCFNMLVVMKNGD